MHSGFNTRRQLQKVTYSQIHTLPINVLFWTFICLLDALIEEELPAVTSSQYVLRLKDCCHLSHP